MKPLGLLINPFSITDPLTWFSGASQSIHNLYVNTVTSIVKVLLASSLPSVKEIKSNFFSLFLGGFYGAAVKFIVLIAVIIMVIFLLSPNRSHGKKFSRLLTSLGVLIVFDFVFYPLYSLVYGLSQGVTLAILHVVTGSSNGTIAQLNQIIGNATGGTAADQLFAVALSYLFAFIALIEVVAIQIGLFLVIAFYPMIIALRPLGDITDVFFHAANSALIVIMLSPPLMAFGFILPLAVQDIIPGGSIPGVTSVLTVIGALFAFAAPAALAFFVFQSSSRIFGNVESSMRGAIDVATMPDINLSDIQNNIKDTHSFPLLSVVADVVGDNLQSDDLFGDMKRTALDFVGTSLAATGNPLLGLAVKAAPVIKEKFMGGNQESPSESAPESTP